MKWLILNARSRFQFALRHPGYTLRALARELTWADERFLASVSRGRAIEIRRFLAEPSRTNDFLEQLRRAEAIFAEARVKSADLFAKKVLIQYALVRSLRPDVVVETGVANGVSSAYLLLALHRNQNGILHSVEIGDTGFLPRGFAPGWIVPDFLKDRWALHLGDAKDLLPALLQQLKQLDIFIHDSLHTYEHMRCEMELAHPYLRPGGLLLADDATWNSAFHDFARAVKAPEAQIVRGVGILQKRQP